MATLTERNIVLVSKDANGNTCLDYPLTKTEQVEGLEDYVKEHGSNLDVMTGATSSAAGKAGLAPAPSAGSQNLPLCGGAKYKVLPVEGGGTGANTVAAAVKALFGSSAVGSSTKSIYYDGATLKACADSIGGGGIVAQLLGQNGYVKFVNGLILQWGMDNKTGIETFTFPVSFTTIYACLIQDYWSRHVNSYTPEIITLGNSSVTFFHRGDVANYIFAVGI